MTLKPGPYAEVPIDGGERAPFYALRFDRDGRTEAPLTEQHLLDTLRQSEYTDVYLFSHGWNNDWQTALKHYTDFIAAYQELRRHDGIRFDRSYRPLLAGICWPSTVRKFGSPESP